ncbi:aldehyde dehydrogenase family 3 member B1 [Polypterus senegalus]|uniref:aldehyde dehydrogenase family 3 member B1 n=1 Tax=Polypterus senegalus TaxID=55291 RepID=UPI001964FC10|nr:aldehyde dehydrogenase family 3 member B1 [Polypterus senegalus]
MLPSPPSPSPSRWFRSLRRLKSNGQASRTPASVCAEMLKKSREAFESKKTAEESFRLGQLDGIVRMVVENEDDFVETLNGDLHKPRFESLLSELILVKNEALFAINNLKKWMQPEHVERNLATTLDQCFLVNEPMGVVLIVGDWSAPVQQCLVPLVGAIAAGNAVLLKPSENSSHTAELLQKLFPLYLDKECYQVVCDVMLADLLELRFDHIFYTGTFTKAQQVMQAASHHLSPVTLVVGGKNPCYVDQMCDLPVAAHRIAWARFHNAGQNNVAPDYILCHAEIRDKLVQALTSCVLEFYGAEPAQSASFGRLVNMEHFLRVRELMLSSGKVVIGGEVDESDKFIAPTVLLDVQESDAIMKHEILGPILPILTVYNADEAIDFVRRKDKPLCLYVYSSNPKVISKFLTCTSSGSFCANDSAIQSSLVTLPVAGVGASGMGLYHGRYSFDTFSHRKSCVLRTTHVECVTYLRFPPYEDQRLSLMMWATSLSRKGAGWCNLL